jgi:hypothetical protein
MPTHHILLDFIQRTIVGEQCRSLSPICHNMRYIYTLSNPTETHSAVLHLFCQAKLTDFGEVMGSGWQYCFPHTPGNENTLYEVQKQGA